MAHAVNQTWSMDFDDGLSDGRRIRCLPGMGIFAGKTDGKLSPVLTTWNSLYRELKQCYGIPIDVYNMAEFQKKQNKGIHKDAIVVLLKSRFP